MISWVPMIPSRQEVETLKDRLDQSIVEMTQALAREHATTPGTEAFDVAREEYREKEGLFYDARDAYQAARRQLIDGPLGL